MALDGAEEADFGDELVGFAVDFANALDRRLLRRLLVHALHHHAKRAHPYG